MAVNTAAPKVVTYILVPSMRIEPSSPSISHRKRLRPSVVLIPPRMMMLAIAPDFNLPVKATWSGEVTSMVLSALFPSRMTAAIG